MIYIVASRPKRNEQREGFLQRVWAIDRLLINEDCVYDGDFTSAEEKKAAMLDASVIYVHSIYNAEKIISLYPLLGYKIITDMHGVVPEEQQLMGEIECSQRLQTIEEEVFKYGKYFIAVTYAMMEHFKSKYKSASSKDWIILPIFNDELQLDVQGKQYTGSQVIYSGGGQKWQNCELMMKSFINARKKPALTILSNDTKYFDALIKQTSDTKHEVHLKSVANQKIANYYDASDMGFILRDNSIINKVACPTKLIEYIKRGIVPIILSEDIGDFKSFGYSYIKCKDFKSGKYDPQKLRDAAMHNVEVFSRLEAISKNGVAELMSAIGNLRVSKVRDEAQLVISKKYVENLNRIERLEEKLEAERKKVGELEAHISERDKFIEQLLHSKRWRLGEIVSYPRRLIKANKQK